MYRRRFKGEPSAQKIPPVNIYKQPQLRDLRPGLHDFKVGGRKKKEAYVRSFFITIRLDRLLLLLDTGSTPLVRSTAAKQLAQLAVKGVISDVSIVEDDLKSAQSRQQVALVDGAAWSELLSVVARVGIVFSSKISFF